MSKLIIGIAAACLICFFSSAVYQALLYLALPVYESLWQAIRGGLVAGVVGMVLAFIVVMLYGLPVFLILRKYRLASTYSAILTALFPWAVLYLIVEFAPISFIEYAWYSICSAVAFWHFAKKTVPNVQEAT